MKCKKFDECIQPHICGPSTACIWGQQSEQEEALVLRDKELWNAAIEMAAQIIDDCNREGPYNAIGGARRIRELKK